MDEHLIRLSDPKQGMALMSSLAVFRLPARFSRKDGLNLSLHGDFAAGAAVFAQPPFPFSNAQQSPHQQLFELLSAPIFPGACLFAFSSLDCCAFFRSGFEFPGFIQPSLRRPEVDFLQMFS